MADMNEVNKTISVKEWDRSNYVGIDNTFNKLSSATFLVEAARLEDGTDFSSKERGKFRVEFDQTEVYPLVNPLDDTVIDPTGGNHSALQIQLYSLFKYRSTL